MAVDTKFEVKTVAGVEIFAAGTWTDAFGMTRTWAESDLDNMVKEFEAGQEIPLKVGHTTDAFNLKLAVDLGVPVELLTGEFGQGAMGLGKVASLVCSNDKLVANFIDVPEPLANLIEGGNYSAVSVELRFNENEGPVATGVALLGAEEPAVDVLAPLDVVDIFKKQSQVFAFSNGSIKIDEGRMRLRFAESAIKSLAAVAAEKEERGMVNTVLKDDALDTKFSLSADEFGQLWEALGVGEHSDIGTMLSAITEMKKSKNADDDDDEKDKESKNTKDDDDDEKTKNRKSKNQDDDDDEEDEEKKKMQASNPEIAELKKTVEKQGAYIAGLEHEKRVAKFTKMAEGWDSIPGKPSDFGDELADIEEKLGEEPAKKLVASYSKANEAGQRANVINSVGSARAKLPEEMDEFEREIHDHSKKEGISYEKAVMHFASTRGREFDEWHNRVLLKKEG